MKTRALTTTAPSTQPLFVTVGLDTRGSQWRRKSNLTAIELSGDHWEGIPGTEPSRLMPGTIDIRTCQSVNIENDVVCSFRALKRRTLCRRQLRTVSVNPLEKKEQTSVILVALNRRIRGSRPNGASPLVSVYCILHQPSGSIRGRQFFFGGYGRRPDAQTDVTLN